MGREPKQGTDGKQEQGNRGKCLRTGRTTARQQGHFCFAERRRTIAGWQGQSAYARDGQQSSEDREPKQQRGGRQQGSEDREPKQQRGGRQQGSEDREPTQGSEGKQGSEDREPKQ